MAVDRHSVFLAGLTASVLGVYGLIMLGATAGITESLAACETWPTCDGRWFVGPSEPGFIGWSHRLTALIVGIVLVATTVAARGAGLDRRTWAVILLAMGLYPIQLGMGAAVSLLGAGMGRSVVHLVLAMTIFSLLVLALAWSLERRFPIEEGIQGDASRPSRDKAVPSVSGWRGTVWAYVQLTKPRLMWLLCLVAVAGMALAAGRGLDARTVVATLLAGVLAIGSAGTFNHVLERDVDRRMARTSDRPLVTNVVPVRNAVTFGAILGVASIAVFVTFLNWAAALLGLAAIVFYSVVYTLILKPHTVQNTVIGGVAGSLPALIGWAAVTGRIGLPALLLAAVIFCWTPAHFYNLAMAYREDYARGGFPMLPVVRGDSVARKHILLYAGVTLLMAAALAFVSSLDWLYAVGGVLAGAGFLGAIVHLHRSHTQAAALRTFHASNAYLGLILVLVTVDAVIL